MKTRKRTSRVSREYRREFEFVVCSFDLVSECTRRKARINCTEKFAENFFVIIRSLRRILRRVEYILNLVDETYVIPTVRYINNSRLRWKTSFYA